MDFSNSVAGGGGPRGLRLLDRTSLVYRRLLRERDPDHERNHVAARVPDFHSAMGLTTLLNSSAIPFTGESHIGKPRQNPSVIGACCSQQSGPSCYQATSQRR